MQKLKLTRKNKEVFLTLDYCKRCGGVWFDRDEVNLAQQIQSPKIRQKILQQPQARHVHCHNCNTLMDRNLEQCPGCGWHNRIACPVCEKQLERTQHQQLTLDVCRSCQGVWFDQIELLALWNGSLLGTTNSPKHAPTLMPSSPTSQEQYQGNVVTQAVGDAVVQGTVDGLTYGFGSSLDPGVQALAETAASAAKGTANVLTYTPEMARGVAESLAEVTGAALESMPEAATVVLEVTGEVAGGMAEFLAAAIASLFGG